jgi:hypothetical protein
MPEDGVEQGAKFLKQLGFDSVVAGLDREVVAEVTSAGLSAFVCTGTFTVDPARDPDLLAVDVDGRRRFWFGSGCPNQLELRSRHKSTVLEALSWPEVSGFYLDGIRFRISEGRAGRVSHLFLRCLRAAGARHETRLRADALTR